MTLEVGKAFMMGRSLNSNRPGCQHAVANVRAGTTGCGTRMHLKSVSYQSEPIEAVLCLRTGCVEYMPTTTKGRKR